MCNLYRLEKGPEAVAELARDMGRQLTFPEGVPNFEPRDVRITDRASLLRAAPAGGALELVARRWSWPGPGGKPVFNLRSEGRRFAPAERCVVLADGFYEFTAPAASADAPKSKRKDRWLFTWPDFPLFGIAGVLRADPEVGEAFSLLTGPPGPDIAPYHHRQIVLLDPAGALAWLDPAGSWETPIAPLPPGSLAVAACSAPPAAGEPARQLL